MHAIMDCNTVPRAKASISPLDEATSVETESKNGLDSASAVAEANVHAPHICPSLLPSMWADILFPFALSDRVFPCR